MEQSTMNDLCRETVQFVALRESLAKNEREFYELESC